MPFLNNYFELMDLVCIALMMATKRYVKFAQMVVAAKDFVSTQHHSKVELQGIPIQIEAQGCQDCLALKMVSFRGQ